MPIYEYRCRSCGKQFEDLVRMGTPEEEIECPNCHEHHAQRLLSIFSGQTSDPCSSTTTVASSGGSGFS